MAIKKSELYSSLWAGADSLRGGMDASEYKNYVLNLLFLKYISDKARNDAKNHIESAIEVPKGCFYEDILALEGDKQIGDKLNKIIAKIAERNGLEGVIDSVDFNDNTKLGEGKAMIDTLSNLVKIFADLSLGAHGALDDDLLGDAYEYLMRHFASESGKSKGQFYTPSEVSLLLSLLLGIDENTRQDKSIYDPTCGSGSLLLKASSLAGEKGLTIYGQEKDISTTALCKMNMILHNSADADIAKGGSSTLSNPLFIENGMLKTFDYVVANPPFSLKNWTDGLSIDYKSKQVINDRFNRFEDGTPPEKNGDFAFLLHIIKSLKNTGKGAVILPHGVLFRGNAEGVIRKNLLTKGYIKGVIGLAPNLFYGTSIPECVVVLDKENVHARKGVFLIDASKDFKKDGNKNRLREQDVQKMIDTFNALKEIPYYSKMVSLEEISANDYNLNIARYIAAKQESEKDLFALINSHKASYLPQNEIEIYAPYFRVFKELKNTLFKKSDKEGYYALKTECENIKDLITQSQEFQAFHASVLNAFDRLELFTTFNDLEPGFNPKTLIESVCSKVLKEFEKGEILDKYGVYQLFKDYYNRNTLIPLPTLNEQIAIANILSALDNYLHALNSLILKKEGVKKALSFELLSQRKRLKGFNQAWQRVRLGDICEIVKGQQINKISLNNTDKYPVINGGIDFLGYTNKFNVSKNTIAISEGGTCGYVRFMTSNFWSGGHNYSLQKISNKVNNLCLYHILKSYEKDIMKLGVGSGLKNIQLKALKDFEIFLPPLNEQIAIANILSDLDHEIISLKNKKRQFDNIKKALNHDLMSAKIRVLKKSVLQQK
ncbi:hypothetical protein NP0150_06880 [Helicobacter pylori]